MTSKLRKAVKNILLEEKNKKKTAMQHLEERVEERCAETIEIGGITVNKVLLALGNADPKILLRRQYVMEWLLAGRVHPEDGKVSLHRIAEKFQVTVGTVQKDVQLIQGAMASAFKSAEIMEEEVLTMMARTWTRVEDNIGISREGLQRIDKAMRFLENTYGDYLFTHESLPLSVDKKKIPMDVRDQFNSLKTMSLKDARKWYKDLMKLRNDAVDRVMKATGDGGRFIKELLAASQNRGGGDGGDLPGGTFPGVAYLTINQDNRQQTIGFSGPLTRDQVIEQTRMDGFGASLPLGLGSDALEKEAKKAAQAEYQEKMDAVKR